MKEQILIYANSTFGLGHLYRSLSLAVVLHKQYDVHLAYGGPYLNEVVYGNKLPQNIHLYQLPELTDDSFTQDIDFTSRVEILKGIVERHNPEYLIMEHVPFGRRNFKKEVKSLISLCPKAKVISSFRGIAAKDDTKILERLEEAKKDFSLYLVHNDREEYSIPWIGTASVRHTGYLPPFNFDRHVEPQEVRKQLGVRDGKLIMLSSGGGKDGEEFLAKAIQALKKIKHPIKVLVSTGPFIPSQSFEKIRGLVDSRFLVTKFNPHFNLYLEHADLSMNMCGYNTMSAVYYYKVPSLVYPRTTDKEQMIRADYFESRGIVKKLKEDEDWTKAIEERLETDKVYSILPRTYDAVPDMIGILNKEGPYEADIRIIRDCNNKCIMCDHWRDPARHEKIIDLPTMRRLIGDLKTMGTKKIILTGGEPMLHQDFYKICDFIKEKDMILSLKTNGTLINSDSITRFSKYSLDFISISIDSPDMVMHEKIRGVKGCFATTTGAFTLIKEHLPEVTTHTNMVVMRQNFRSLKNVAEMAKDLGIRHITLTLVRKFNDFVQNMEMNVEELEEYYYQIVPHIMDNPHGIRVNLAPHQKSLIGLSQKEIAEKLRNRAIGVEHLKDGRHGRQFYSEYYCHKPIDRVEIRSDGTVVPCCGLLDSKGLHMGNIKEQSMIEIWNSPKYANFRETDTLPRVPGCLHCSSYQFQNKKRATF